MDRKSRFLIGLFIVTSIFVVTFLFCKFYIQTDYNLRNEVECDPGTESCFVRSCGEDCEGEESWYYKVRTVSAQDIALCDPHLGECPQVECLSVASCVEELCTEDSVPEGEHCSNALDLQVEPDERELLEKDSETEEIKEDSEEIAK